MFHFRSCSAATAVLLLSQALVAAPDAAGRGANSGDATAPVGRSAASAPDAAAKPGNADTAGRTGIGVETSARGAGLRMRLSNLPPAKVMPGLCKLHYPVSTTSTECQTFVDQGLGFFYSYVWMEAARSLESATQADPDCALAWWCLSRALERYDRKDQATEALLKADALKAKASPREQMLILTTMQEKGHAPGVGNADARKKAAIATLDNMLAIYDDDEEGWYYRAQLAGGSGLFGGQVSAVPFYKALLQINPLHPGANHELVHFYEGFQRPALGVPYAEKYIESSPSIPHPFHMQAHLATRLGRWKITSDRSRHAIELERAYHKFMDVKPSEDHQFSHHLEILLRSLTHDGRFAEARAIKEEGLAAKLELNEPYFRLHLAERAYAEALQLAAQHGKKDKTESSYWSALVYLKQGDAPRAVAEIEVLQEACRVHANKKADRRAELRLWEAQGIYLCQAGSVDVGLKLLGRCVEKTKDDFSHHSWGNGSYYMEAWGTAALLAGRDSVAEEAFLEALAHDPGSVRAALGLQVLCERQGRSDEASRYGELARRCWARAEVRHLDAERAALVATPSNATAAAGR